ncbi:MAG TPA: hypothetical protein PKA53_04655 [Sphingobacterium sp.]|nr:hypothetical protein [Sphingobacterium sp.]
MKNLLVLVSIPLFGSTPIATTALSDLRNLLHSENEWVKVHVAEFLLWENQCVDEVREVFLKEEQQFGHTPKYRIGIWRVLAQAAADEKDQQYWEDKIITAYNDIEGEDRLHAIETLAKLKVYVARDVPTNMESSFRLYSLWNQALGSSREQRKVKDLLVSDLVDDKLTELEIHVTSYILRYIGPLSGREYHQIISWMQGKDIKMALRSNLLATLVISCPKNQSSDALETLKKEMISLREHKEAVPHIMMALAQKGGVSDSGVISELYAAMRDVKSTDYNSDLHATAAYMVLKAANNVVVD